MRTAVLFDMDGVLVETEILKAQAHSETVRSFGGSVRPEFYDSVMGQSHKAVLSAFLKEAGISVTEDDYSRVCKGIYTDKIRSTISSLPPAFLPP
jgi:beta-phosphoglucomutase-like phosphatase (HAD superfamily)